MVVSIHQPDYIPWLGTFYKMSHSDVFIYLDDAQYSNKAAHDFNYIKTPQGSYRLRIPVEQHLGDKILQVKTKDNLNWKEKHLKTISMNYCRSPFFQEIFTDLSDVINQKEEHFLGRNLKLSYIDYEPITYSQCWGEFLPCMSVIDYIFNCGFDWEYVERTVRTNSRIGESRDVF